MCKRKIYPNVFSSDFVCEFNNDKGYCKQCWEKYLKVQLAPFKRLSLHQVIFRNDSEIKFVTSDEYKEWLYTYLQNHDVLSDTDVFYFGNENDKKYVSSLHLFLTYISDLVDETDYENLANYEDFETERYFFRIKDKTFEIVAITGQGSSIFISNAKYSEDCILL